MTDAARLAATGAYRVRFDECTPAGVLRAASYLRYAQDIAWIHSERLGYDRGWYAQRGLGWLVRGIQLVLAEPSWSSDVLTLTTRVVGFRRVWARRRTDVRAADGRLVAWAFTDYVMTDARGFPTRIPREFPAQFGARLGTFTPTKVSLPATPLDAVVLRSVVRPHELDPMGHVNNAAYLEWVDEAVESLGVRDPSSVGGEGAPAFRPRTYSLEYLLPIVPRTSLVAHVWSGGEAVAYRLEDAEGAESFRARLDPGAVTPQAGADRGVAAFG